MSAAADTATLRECISERDAQAARVTALSSKLRALEDRADELGKANRQRDLEFKRAIGADVAGETVDLAGVRAASRAAGEALAEVDLAVVALGERLSDERAALEKLSRHVSAVGAAIAVQRARVISNEVERRADALGRLRLELHELSLLARGLATHAAGSMRDPVSPPPDHEIVARAGIDYEHARSLVVSSLFSSVVTSVDGCGSPAPAA